MSFLRQLNDAIIEQLDVTCRFEPATGDTIHVGEDFKVIISIGNSSKQYPQITYLNVALEVAPVPPLSKFKDGDPLLKRRELLGEIDWNTKKELVFEMTATGLAAFDWEEEVVKTSIAADVLLRCKDLNHPHKTQIRDED
jgi:hypothetical protein